MTSMRRITASCVFTSFRNDSRPRAMNCATGLEYVAQKQAIWSHHKGRASARTRERNNGCRPPSLTRSTRIPSSFSMSMRSPANSNSDICGPGLINRSRSDEAVSSPRATDPKTRTPSAPALRASARISPRFALTASDGRIWSTLSLLQSEKYSIGLKLRSLLQQEIGGNRLPGARRRRRAPGRERL